MEYTNAYLPVPNKPVKKKPHANRGPQTSRCTILPVVALVRVIGVSSAKGERTSG